MLNILRSINQFYISQVFKDFNDKTTYRIVHVQIMFLNLLDIMFLITSFYCSSNLFLEILSSLPGIGYSIYLHHNIIEAKEYNDDFSIIFIECGYLFTLLAMGIQFSTSIHNVSNSFDIKLLMIDMILIFLNIPIISGLMHYFTKREIY